MTGFCYSCDGTGSDRVDHQNKAVRCPDCDGTGEKIYQPTQSIYELIERGVAATERINDLTPDLEASQQRVAVLEAALENIGNMAYTALHMNGDIRDRNLAELEHACMLILAEVNDLEGEDSPTKEETR